MACNSVPDQSRDRYVEVASVTAMREAKGLPSNDLEERVYSTIQKEVYSLLGNKLLEAKKQEVV